MIVKANKNMCCGCEACANVCPLGCITMQPDVAGFQYPVIDEAGCVHCNKCETACPLSAPPTVNKDKTEAFAAKDKNTARRERASSGGVFGLLAEHILSLGGAVFGAAYDAAFQVVHEKVERMEGLDSLRRAKYAQSEIGATMAEARTLLQAGRWVLFSGTPCQIAGLKAFLGKDYPTLLTVDVVCFAVPSPNAWRSYVAYRQKRDGSPELPRTINQREKSTGWSHYRYASRIAYPNGREYAAPNGKDPYMQAMLSGLITRPSCADCRFRGLERCSDLTLGDYWGIWDTAPEMDDDKGTSLVLVHSDRGREFLQAISGELVLLRTGAEEATRENPRILTSVKENPDKAAFLTAPDWDKLAKQMQKSSERSFLQKLRHKLQKFLSGRQE